MQRTLRRGSVPAAAAIAADRLSPPPAMRELPCSWLSAVESKAGPEPGRQNEDRVISTQLTTDCGWWSLYAALDGHGGSQAVIAVAHELPELMAACFNDVAKELEPAAADAPSDDLIAPFRSAAELRFSALDKRLRASCSDRSGVCVTACVVSHALPLRGLVVHLGDCRAVLSTGTTKPRTLTRDHHLGSNPSERRRVMATGAPTLRGRVLGLEPTRTLGDWDVKEAAPGAVSCVPEVHEIPFAEALSPRANPPKKAAAAGICQLVVATDGLWGVAKGDEAARVAAQSISRHGRKFPLGHKEAARSLVELARRKGSYDDCSVVVVTFGEN
eukprot:TRINITY_DN24755_c0_g2_i1.p1 TRINITY_DN24755_c0_g2~~TRINITY_DN24755_c0_g2_i1.p1  ORF type:complete len:330 (+),score=76.47 TRINITY_DN24755_c0_g2_i1:70-1059(+)